MKHLRNYLWNALSCMRTSYSIGRDAIEIWSRARGGTGEISNPALGLCLLLSKLRPQDVLLSLEILILLIQLFVKAAFQLEIVGRVREWWTEWQALVAERGTTRGPPVPGSLCRLISIVLSRATTGPRFAIGLA